jgi:hypothetical protein
VDVGNNDIPADNLQEIDQAVRSNRLRLIREDSNKSLSEIDLSSRYLDAKDAIVVAEYIKDNGALTALDVSNNCLGEIVLVDGITHCKAKSGTMLYWDKDNKSLGEKLPPGCGPLGVIAIANAIPDMRALIKLDISNNHIGAEQERGLQRICVAGGIQLAN